MKSSNSVTEANQSIPGEIIRAGPHRNWSSMAQVCLSVGNSSHKARTTSEPSV